MPKLQSLCTNFHNPIFVSVIWVCFSFKSGANKLSFNKMGNTPDSRVWSVWGTHLLVQSN